ncbi:hypothetical protein KCU64_g8123, partial [Aureobasidium melanogenum]
MSTLPAQQSAAKPASGAVSTPDKQPSTEHFQGTVILIVGKKKKAYTLHKDLLCFYSDYFRAAFNGSFKEAAERKLELPNVEEHIFEGAQLWLYTRNLQKPIDKLDCYEFLVGLWIFGDQHQIPLLQNQVMDEIFAKYKATRIFASKLVRTVYEKTMAGSPLRKAFIEIIAYTMHLEPSPGTFLYREHEVYWTSESLIDLVLAINQARLNKTVQFASLPQRDKCFFHIHSKNEHC